MAKHLHRNFLRSEAAYRAVEQFWRDLVARLALRHGQASQWISWQDKTFKDGTPEPLDGNPIFEARCEPIRRAVRVIQQEPEWNECEIAAWIDTFDFSDSGGPGFTEELVINLSLSVEAAQAAETLIDRWMDQSVSRERMEDLIMATIGSGGS